MKEAMALLRTSGSDNLHPQFGSARGAVPGLKKGGRLDAERWLQVAAFLYEKASGLGRVWPMTADGSLEDHEDVETVLPEASPTVQRATSQPASVGCGDSPSAIIELGDLDATISSCPGGLHTPRATTGLNSGTQPRNRRDSIRGISPASSPNTTCSIFNLTMLSTPPTLSKASAGQASERVPLAPVLLTPSAADIVEPNSNNVKTSDSKFAWSLSDKPTRWAAREDGTCARSLLQSYLSEPSEHWQTSLPDEDQENRGDGFQKPIAEPPTPPQTRLAAPADTSTDRQVAEPTSSRWQVVRPETSAHLDDSEEGTCTAKQGGAKSTTQRQRTVGAFVAKIEEQNLSAEEQKKTTNLDCRFSVVERGVSPRQATQTPPTSAQGHRPCLTGAAIQSSAATNVRRPSPPPTGGQATEVPQGISSANSDTARVRVSTSSAQGEPHVRGYKPTVRAGLGTLSSQMSTSSLSSGRPSVSLDSGCRNKLATPGSHVAAARAGIVTSSARQDSSSTSRHSTAGSSHRFQVSAAGSGVIAAQGPPRTFVVSHLHAGTAVPAAVPQNHSPPPSFVPLAPHAVNGSSARTSSQPATVRGVSPRFTAVSAAPVQCGSINTSVSPQSSACRGVMNSSYTPFANQGSINCSAGGVVSARLPRGAGPCMHRHSQESTSISPRL